MYQYSQRDCLLVRFESIRTGRPVLHPVTFSQRLLALLHPRHHIWGRRDGSSGATTATRGLSRGDPHAVALPLFRERPGFLGHQPAAWRGARANKGQPGTVHDGARGCSSCAHVHLLFVACVLFFVTVVRFFVGKNTRPSLS